MRVLMLASGTGSIRDAQQADRSDEGGCGRSLEATCPGGPAARLPSSTGAAGLLWEREMFTTGLLSFRIHHACIQREPVAHCEGMVLLCSFVITGLFLRFKASWTCFPGHRLNH